MTASWRQCLGGLVLATALLGGCSGSEPSLTTKGQLPELVLQQSDLGQGYERFDEGRLAIADRPQPPRDDPGRFGRIDGWKARYRVIPDEDPAPELAAAAVVESRVDLFPDADGAQRELTMHREQLTTGGAGEVTDRAGLGEEAFVLEQQQLAGGDVAFVTVAWRQDNLTASVTVNGSRAGATRAALRLARDQQERLREPAQK